MAEGKWIPGLTVNMPAIEAARKVLGERLHVVRHFLPLAIESADEDMEYIHQLRVGTRRAGAALRIFAECLTPKRHHSIRRKVKRIRRAAGAARDWDVFQETLAEWSQKRPATEQPGLDFLRGYAFFQRQAAQIGLNDVAATAPDTPDDHDFVSHAHSARLANLALSTLTESLGQLHEAIEQPSDAYEHLHQIRIIGKRVRYVMEVFVDCFAASFRAELYPAIETMQEILGDANDSHVAAQRLAELRDRLQQSRPTDWPRFKLGIERLLQYHRRKLPMQRRKFGEWQKRWQALQTPLADLLLKE